MTWELIGQISNSATGNPSDTPWYIYLIFGSVLSGLTTAIGVLWKALDRAHTKYEAVMKDDLAVFGEHIAATSAATAAVAEQARATDRLSDKVDHLVEMVVSRGSAR